MSLIDTFWNSFIKSSSLIAATEFGDRTFFITLIMSVQKPPTIVFMAAMTAMIVMNIVSSMFLCGLL